MIQNYLSLNAEAERLSEGVEDARRTPGRRGTMPVLSEVEGK